MGSASLAADRCDLCGARLANARQRVRHLRTAHPDYARNVLARIAAPVVFLGALLVLSALHAPPAAYVAALLGSYGLVFFGKVGSRRARARARVRPTLGFARMLREGGLRFALLVPVVALVVLLLGLVT